MADTAPILPGDDPASIERAAEVLRGGGLVGMPTETVYGLAANAVDPAAVAKIFEAKQRPSFDPLIVHFNSLEWVFGYAELTVGSKPYLLAEAFWPGPLTLVIPREPASECAELNIPDIVTSGLDTVGIRVPMHPVALALLNKVDFPLAAPSANRFGSISPTRAEHVAEELGDKVDLILDGGPCECGLESTVVRVTSDRIEVLRLGALSVSMIEQALGESVEVMAPTSSPGGVLAEQAKPSPGMSARHYAPGTPMDLFDSPMQLASIDPDSRVGLIGVGDLSRCAAVVVERNLSPTEDLSEAAAGLFQALRELDAMGLDRIVAMKVPDEGIGRAINDRLRRGCVR